MTTVHEGTANVFADMGLSDPQERQAKALLAIHIEQAMNKAGFNHAAAAERMGLSPDDLARIISGRLRAFTIVRLAECLAALD